MLLVSSLAIALCGCAGGKAGKDSLITIGIPQDLDESLDPHIAEGAGTREVLFNVFEGLVKPNSNGDLIPAVASDYNINEDGTVYTFTLRKGVKFHNGKELTSDDVMYSIQKAIDSSLSGYKTVSCTCGKHSISDIPQRMQK